METLQYTWPHYERWLGTPGTSRVFKFAHRRYQMGVRNGCIQLLLKGKIA